METMRVGILNPEIPNFLSWLKPCIQQIFRTVIGSLNNKTSTNTLIKKRNIFKTFNAKLQLKGDCLQENKRWRNFLSPNCLHRIEYIYIHSHMGYKKEVKGKVLK